MNLSGSSSSLTSDASTKAGTASLRSYGIGGALLYKRFLLMTRQLSPEEMQGQAGDQAEKQMQTEGRRGRGRERGTEMREAGEDAVAVPGHQISAAGMRRGRSADGGAGRGAGTSPDLP